MRRTASATLCTLARQAVRLFPICSNAGDELLIVLLVCSATSGSDTGHDDQPATSRRDAKKSRRPKAAPKSGKKRKTTDGGEAADEAEEAGVEAVELFCLCRQPDDGREFIECDSCNQWYHCECVGVNLQVRQPSSSSPSGHCSRCTEVVLKRVCSLQCLSGWFLWLCFHYIYIATIAMLVSP